jgi:hypothetical protein
MGILGKALDFTGNFARNFAPVVDQYQRRKAMEAEKREAREEKEQQRNLEQAKRVQDEAYQALLMENLRQRNEDLSKPDSNDFTYQGKKFKTAEEVAAARRLIDPDKPRETDPLIAEERRERIEDRRRSQVVDRATGHARRWAQENFKNYDGRRLNREIDKALVKFYPQLSSGERSSIIASAVSDATSDNLAVNRDTRAAEPSGASGLLTELLKGEGAGSSRGSPKGRSRDGAVPTVAAGKGLSVEQAPLSAGSNGTPQDRQVRLREQILNDNRLSPRQKQELLDSLRAVGGGSE